MRFPDAARRAFHRSSVALAVAGLAITASAITALATIDSGSGTPRADREMTLSATEDETTTTTSMMAGVSDDESEVVTVADPTTTTTTTSSSATTGQPMPVAERLDNHETRLSRLEDTVATTTTTTEPAAASVGEDTTTTTTAAPTTTTTAALRYGWVEVARFKWDAPLGTAAPFSEVVTLEGGKLQVVGMQNGPRMMPWQQMVWLGTDATPTQACPATADNTGNTIDYTPRTTPDCAWRGAWPAGQTTVQYGSYRTDAGWVAPQMSSGDVRVEEWRQVA
ncbi:MAG: hypothetical protein LC798_19120 [Chloroflexi bacterium]|nr:hypothetical protein [Chloroflexota bacterium]